MRKQTFGEVLRAERESRGMSQYELSARSGVTQNAITRIETGRRYPMLVTMRLLAAGLDADLVIGFDSKRVEEFVNGTTKRRPTR